MIHLTRLAGARKSRYDVEEERAEARALVTDVVRGVCRAHSPFDPGSAETMANERVAEHFARHGTLRHRWSAKARISAAEEVRRLQRQAQTVQHGIIAKAEADALHLHRLQELAALGESFLAGCEDRWITRYAVRLAQNPETAAEILTQMLDERRQHAEGFVKLVNETSATYRQADILQLVVTGEGALRHALKQLGVDVPPLRSDSLFSEFSGSSRPAE